MVITGINEEIALSIKKKTGQNMDSNGDYRPLIFISGKNQQYITPVDMGSMDKNNTENI